MTRSGRGNGGPPEYPEIGERLRDARRSQGLSLRELAGRLGVSPSLISQVETGRAKPSVKTLYAITNELGVSLDELLFSDQARPREAARADAERTVPAADQAPVAAAVASAPVTPSAGPVQRSHDRKTIRLASGVVWERLSTESIPNVDFLAVTYEVGGASSPEHEFQRHGGYEWGYVISGRLGVTIGFDDYELGPGDAVSLDSTVPHRMYNLGEEPVHGIWFVAGRRPMEDTIDMLLAGRNRVRPEAGPQE